MLSNVKLAIGFSIRWRDPYGQVHWGTVQRFPQEGGIDVLRDDGLKCCIRPSEVDMEGDNRRVHISNGQWVIAAFIVSIMTVLLYLFSGAFGWGILQIPLLIAMVFLGIYLTIVVGIACVELIKIRLTSRSIDTISDLPAANTNN